MDLPKRPFDYKRQVVYQIYPRSYKDTNRDGIGDLKGITEKLDYLKDLGITSIWISPCFSSPMEDGGYDISDYYRIDPIFGTNEDMDEFISEAKKRGIGIILDLVANHTSADHFWFQEALKGKDNPYHDFYIFRDKPNELRSVFGGSAWEYVPTLDQYHLHLFARRQPDLNWSNKRLRQEIYRMMNYWLDRGVYGFRMDVIENIGKEPDRLITTNGPKLHDYLQEMHREVFQGRESFTVGECWDADNVGRTLYTDPSRKELNMVFQFDWFKEYENTPHGKFDRRKPVLSRVRDILFAQQLVEPSKSWNANFFSNHDLPRASMNFITDMKYRDDASKMFLALELFLRGTPFIYQGEELGMGHPLFNDISEIRDVEALNHYRIFVDEGIPEEKAFRMVAVNGRDNSRTPMQWDSTDNAGFSTSEPWLKICEDYRVYNVESESKDPDSVLSFCKTALALRKQDDILDTLVDGTFVPEMEGDDKVIAFRIEGKKTFHFVSNISPKEIGNPAYGKEILLENKGRDKVLPPYAVAIYLE